MNQVVVDGALWLAILIAMLAGLISFASPCVLPLVPGYLGFLGGAAAPIPAECRHLRRNPVIRCGFRGNLRRS